MITQAEVDNKGKKIAIYHRAGMTEQGKDTKYNWTHSMAAAKKCEACLHGRIPADISKGKP